MLVNLIITLIEYSIYVAGEIEYQTKLRLKAKFRLVLNFAYNIYTYSGDRIEIV